jgi:Domain of unknown function (DUF5753)
MVYTLLQRQLPVGRPLPEMVRRLGRRRRTRGSAAYLAAHARTGLLQTPEYARALFRAWRATEDDDEIERLVSARIDRQRIFGRPKPPSFWAVIDEAVLRRRVGSAKVMHDQLSHLTEMADRPMIKLHVIPAEVGAHVGLLGAFSIAGFANDTQGTVYFDTADEGQTTTDPATVAKIILMFDTMRSEALPHGASRDLIMKVAEEYGRDLA